MGALLVLGSPTALEGSSPVNSIQVVLGDKPGGTTRCPCVERAALTMTGRSDTRV